MKEKRKTIILVRCSVCWIRGFDVKRSKLSRNNVEEIFTYRSDKIECHPLYDANTIFSDENTILSDAFWGQYLSSICSLFSNQRYNLNMFSLSSLYPIRLCEKNILTLPLLPVPWYHPTPPP